MLLNNNKYLKIAIYIILIGVLRKSVLSQSSPCILEFPEGIRHIRKKSEILTVFKNIDGKYKVDNVIDLNEYKNIIVEFTSKPLCLKKSKNALYKSIIKNEHNIFKNRLKKFVNSPSVLRKNFTYSKEYEITHEYYKVFNGVAMKCKRGLVNTIKNMPMVKQVYDEITYKTTLMNSVSQIKADKVHQNLGFTGKNVVMGIIDTGIDYLHPALGGNIGVGYKVRGGYDFINDDSDPMDDYGHGTHVAGIIAAKLDSVFGVAPDATLLAVKVLDSNGIGITSDIISGIEYCYDPDNNPDTNDGVDIINMSFGGFTQYPNPIDSVVNYISKAGILSVVAAGNDHEYASINSPGTAQEALTVGACDSTFELASFSSKGPDPIYDYLKPEVVAPGVDIYSTVLNGDFEKHSGTSMAAPHVAGIAALIKEKYSEISPQDLKSLIVNNTQKIENKDVYNIGNGCVDALKAIEDSLIINPGTISFGLADCRLGEWRDTAYFVIKNRFNFTQNINLSILDIPHNLITLNFSEQSFYLKPFRERKINIEIIVPGSVPVKDAAPFTYSGKILCVSNTDSTIIPFGFLKSSVLEIHFDKEPYFSTLINKYTEEHFSWDKFSGKELRIKLSNGNYSFVCYMMENDSSKKYIVGKDNLLVDGYNEYSITYKDAKFKVKNNVYDFNDNLLNNKHLWSNLSYKNLVGFFGGADFISALDTNYNYSSMFRYDKNDVLIGMVHETRGIDNQLDLIIPSGSENLFPYSVEFKFPHENDFQENWCGIWINSSYVGSWTPFTGKTNYKKIYLNKNYNMHDSNNGKSFQLMMEQIKDTTLNILWYKNERIYYGPKMRINEDGKMETFNILFSNLDQFEDKEEKRILVRYYYWPDDSIIISPETEVKYPMQSKIDRKNFVTLDYAGLYNISTPQGICESPFDQKYFMNYYLYSNTDRFNDNDVVKHFDNGRSFYTGYTFFHDYEFSYTNTLKIIGISPVYEICNQKGISITENVFNYNEEDINDDQIIDIPVLELFQIISSGRIVTNVIPGKGNFVQFKLYDEKNNIDKVHTSLIYNNGKEIRLFTEKVFGSEFYKAEIPSDLPNEFIDVIISVKDSMKSTTSFIASPGFYYGEPDNISYENRIHLMKYDMINGEKFQFDNFKINDTLKFQLNYQNIGNVAAEEVNWYFPQNYFFNPVNNKIKLTRNLEPGDSCLINLDLVIKRNNTNDTTFAYSPKVNWKIKEKRFSRTHSVFNQYIKISNPSEQIHIPIEYKLCDNFPNPFNNKTTIPFRIVEDDKVKIAVYNIRGQLIKTLTNRFYGKGYHSVSWDGKNKNGINVSSGIYFYRMDTENGFNKNLKMILLK